MKYKNSLLIMKMFMLHTKHEYLLHNQQTAIGKLTLIYARHAFEILSSEIVSKWFVYIYGCIPFKSISDTILFFYYYLFKGF